VAVYGLAGSPQSHQDFAPRKRGKIFMEADYFWPPGFRPAQAGQNLYGGRLFLATRISPRASGAKSLWRPIISGHQDFAPRKRGKIFMEADYFWPPGFRPAQAGQNLFRGDSAPGHHVHIRQCPAKARI